MSSFSELLLEIYRRLNQRPTRHFQTGALFLCLRSIKSDATELGGLLPVMPFLNESLAKRFSAGLAANSVTETTETAPRRFLFVAFNASISFIARRFRSDASLTCAA
jgi:hypothetical protein